MSLSNSEEQLMEYLWQLEKAFMKDLLEAYPKPKPATTTVATLLKRMIDKEFVSYKEFGNSREYYPLVKKTDYFSKHVNFDAANDHQIAVVNSFDTQMRSNDAC